ncbi:MAG: CoA pyrophosphatase [Lachnospiraceae bacterium]|nr:CoA pyrophosphatase [Lachnospiraceae bacterium]
MDPLSRQMRVRRAAVLIPLIEENGAYSLLYEVRAYDLDVQPGDVCFPGGGVEEGETAEETVLRETEEELLVSRSQITLTRTLPDVSGPGAVVTPFIGILRDYRGTFSGAEVDHVFTVPVSYLRAHPPDVYQAVYEARIPEDFPFEKVHGGRDYEFRSMRHDILFYDIPAHVRTIYDGASAGPQDASLPVLWGFTAKLTHFLLSNYPDPHMPRP